jgi:hypothetical protein
MTVPTERLEYVEDWLDEELRMYVYQKFNQLVDAEHIKEFMQPANGGRSEGWWTQQLDNYYHRAAVLGLDTPNGRQALGKFVATAICMLVATVDVYGELPKPGVPSGENLTELSPL